LQPEAVHFNLPLLNRRPPQVRTETADFDAGLIFEQDPVQIVDALLPLYMNASLLRSLQEALASELAARMNAMNNASDNAGELKRNLTLIMNRKRQAKITTELTVSEQRRREDSLIQDLILPKLLHLVTQNQFLLMFFFHACCVCSHSLHLNLRLAPCPQEIVAVSQQRRREDSLIQDSFFFSGMPVSAPFTPSQPASCPLSAGRFLRLSWREVSGGGNVEQSPITGTQCTDSWLLSRRTLFWQLYSSLGPVTHLIKCRTSRSGCCSACGRWQWCFLLRCPHTDTSFYVNLDGLE
jgi:hypothetical protein